MAFFKTKEEKRIEQEMAREEQMQIFSDQINELKKKREEYANVAAEAEMNGDTGTYDVAVNNLIELNDVISSLMQTKANFDIISISNSIAMNMAMAVNALSNMASGTNKMPNLRKIQKVNVKVARYMREIKISNKAMSSMMSRTNPANKVRTAEEIASIKPMIDAARAKITRQEAPANSALDLSAEIEQVKKKTM